MYRYVMVEKRVGETPLEALRRARDTYSITMEVPMAYAGRLDPMASGKLILLIGNECKNQKTWHGLDKAYDFEVLLGISTDTGDILGIPKFEMSPIPTELNIQNLIPKLAGTVTFPYPVFSSKTVRGKPLFLWTLEGRLHEIEMPTITSRVYDVRYCGSRSVTSSLLQEDILRRINLIHTVTEDSKKLGNDFRRVEIRSAWKSLLSNEQTFTILRFTTVVGPGTYIRTLAPHIGTLLGTTGLAYSIHRTEMGRYISLTPRLGFWLRRY